LLRPGARLPQVLLHFVKPGDGLQRAGRKRLSRLQRFAKLAPRVRPTGGQRDCRMPCRMRSVGGVTVALEDAAEAAEQVLQTGAAPARGHPDASRQAGIAGSVATAAQLLPLGPPSVKRAHLDRRPTGDGGLATPRQRLVQVSGFQHTVFGRGRLPWLHYIDERPDRNSTNRPRNFASSAL
jgi:hypothetical protein